jgi:response regulator RpfG family c-di-GMP phosphodiesterase
MLELSNPNDDLVFADDDHDPVGSAPDKKAWKIMIVDDDPAIHDVTKLALAGFTFAERDLEFIQCYSGREAKEKMAEHPDTALMLLDVVMEDDHAGLEVAKFVRDWLGNRNVRIVLRTGQPGQAPERRVITEYDINDYKEKTELTASKLFTLMHAALRSYRDIETIDASKRGLARIIDASANIFKLTSMNQFAGGVLEQMTSLMNVDLGALYMTAGGLAAELDGDQYKIITGTGVYADSAGRYAHELLESGKTDVLDKIHQMKANVYGDDCFAGFFEDRFGRENLLYLSGIENFDPLDKDLIELFTKNVSIAFENIHLHEDLEATQREIVYMLGEAVETRSQETGNHVKRVAEVCKLMALEYGLGAEEAEIIKLASPLHDVGKIGIPDAILNKPGRHTDEEREIMKTHAAIGYNMLKGSKRRVLNAGATIANEHHERWDGAGYPNRRHGEETHIFGRIAAVADVFDALGSDRCYKKAWPLPQVLDLFREERGKQFEATLVDILLNNMDKVQNIQERYEDPAA